MAVNFVTRYLLSTENVKRGEFQLVGATALLIASKSQESHPPHAVELAELTLGACTAKQISELELHMLQVCVSLFFSFSLYVSVCARVCV